MHPNLNELSNLPQDSEGPVFDEPWEASAFAIAVKLHQDGHFTWPEWVGCYSIEIAALEAATPAGDHVEYYDAWLIALEKMMARKGLLTSKELNDRHDHLRHHPAHHEHEPNREPVCVA
jgi:nitrile hydratase accessory protein